MSAVQPRNPTAATLLAEGSLAWGTGRALFWLFWGLGAASTVAAFAALPTNVGVSVLLGAGALLFFAGSIGVTLLDPGAQRWLSGIASLERQALDVARADGEPAHVTLLRELGHELIRYEADASGSFRLVRGGLPLTDDMLPLLRTVPRNADRLSHATALVALSVTVSVMLLAVTVGTAVTLLAGPEFLRVPLSMATTVSAGLAAVTQDASLRAAGRLLQEAITEFNDDVFTRFRQRAQQLDTSNLPAPPPPQTLLLRFD